MAEHGLLNTERYELINGVRIEKMAKSRPHVNSLRRILIWLTGVFGADRINHEAPIDLKPESDPTNEPEPDAIVLNQPTWNFQSANPKPRDILLVVEVADSTLEFDKEVRAKLYARAGVVEFWLSDLRNKQLLVHRDPGPNGYRSVITHAGADRVAPLAAPDHALTVSTLFD